MTKSNGDFIKQHLRSWLEGQADSLSVNHVLELPIALATDKGTYRSENQDRVAVLRGEKLDGSLYVISVLSDGMGGMKNGGDCASITVSSFMTYIIENIDSLSGPTDNLLKGAAEAANNDVYREYNQNGGATLSAVLYEEGKGYSLVNAGDSRIYLSLPGEIVQLTEDDTLAAQISRGSEWPSNELLQYVGMGEEFEPHVIPLIMSESDARIVLTSDGVHFMETKTLSKMVNNAENPKQLGRRLIELSKWLGSKDNASVITIEPYSEIQDSSKKGPNFFRIYNAHAAFDFMIFENSKISEEEKVKSNQSDLNDKKTSKRKNKEILSKVEKQKKIDSTRDDDKDSHNNDNSEKENKKPQLKISFE